MKKHCPTTGCSQSLPCRAALADPSVGERGRDDNTAEEELGQAAMRALEKIQSKNPGSDLYYTLIGRRHQS
jgi:hypothetical protein